MDSIDAFERSLRENDKSSYTVRGYGSDLRLFARWFQQTNGEPLTPEGVTPTDLREYRHYLRTVERRRASTVNRRLAAISAYLAWAVSEGRMEHNPAQGLKRVETVRSGPRWLTKKEQYALRRAIEKDLQLAKMRYPKRWVGRQRDATLVLLLLNTGLRLGEVRRLRLSDVERTERKGRLLIRQGKGGKERVVPPYPTLFFRFNGGNARHYPPFLVE